MAEHFVPMEDSGAFISDSSEVSEGEYSRQYLAKTSSSAKLVEDVMIIGDQRKKRAREGRGGSVDGALRVRGRYFAPEETCFLCGVAGHMKVDCPRAPKCLFCGERRHGSRNCPRKREIALAGLDGADARLGGSAGGVASDSESSYVALRFAEILREAGGLSRFIARHEVRPVDSGPSEVQSCFFCGEMGHTGYDCKKSLDIHRRSISAPICTARGGAWVPLFPSGWDKT